MKNQQSFLIKLVLSILIILGSVSENVAQVQLRDTTISWQHHSFELNSDYSIKTYSTNDNDIDTIVFKTAKVIENSLIRLVLIPEYGGRILSFVYKPTGHEYLYQSECGSAYNIESGIFYYDWLMVYGGIFPTFPEPEHGKTWLLPWDFSLLKQSSDTITIRMVYTDTTSYSRAPLTYNNGTTAITCQVDVSVFSKSSMWDFNVRLINNKNENVKYEYWTCTTLTPGSEIGNTGSPLNSEIIIPTEKYFAGWSPRSWIGNNNSTYDLSRINMLDEWSDMGIAYAENFQGNYWGVINHENEEGVFRVCDNNETRGLKLWTWGRNNIDNNLFDFSNGGADNYIELWAGVSESFFTDASIGPNQEITWNESYCPTVNLSSICSMNQIGAVDLEWVPEKSEAKYTLNTFNADRNYAVELAIEGSSLQHSITSHQVKFEPNGQSRMFSLDSLNLTDGVYTLSFNMYDSESNLVLSAEKIIEINTASIRNTRQTNDNLIVSQIDRNKFRLEVRNSAKFKYKVMSISGSTYLTGSSDYPSNSISIRTPGLYLIEVKHDDQISIMKVMVE